MCLGPRGWGGGGGWVQGKELTGKDHEFASTQSSSCQGPFLKLRQMSPQWWPLLLPTSTSPPDLHWHPKTASAFLRTGMLNLKLNIHPLFHATKSLFDGLQHSLQISSKCPELLLMPCTGEPDGDLRKPTGQHWVEYTEPVCSTGTQSQITHA